MFFNLSAHLSFSSSVPLQSGIPNYFEKQRGGSSRRFVYKRIPIYDASTSAPQLESHITDIIQFLSNGLCHGSVLVHCHHGVSRSTTSVIFYLMRCVRAVCGGVFIICYDALLFWRFHGFALEIVANPFL